MIDLTRRAQVIIGHFKGASGYEDTYSPIRKRKLKMSVVLSSLSIMIKGGDDEHFLAIMFLNLRSVKALRSYLDRVITEIEERQKDNKWLPK